MNCGTHDTATLFVYGTLMKGQRAHHILQNCPLLGTYTLAGYAMYNLGSYPGIREKDGGTVIGEVYRIPTTLLARLDQYEDEGTLYHRRTVTVTNGEDKLDVLAYIYALAVDPDTLMEKPWGSHS